MQILLSIVLSYCRRRKLILIVTCVYTAVVLLMLLHRFWQFEAFYYDHGMMESTAYQVSQFRLPLFDRGEVRYPIYIDHLYPSLQLVLAPFYWVWNSYEMPIVVMSILIGSSVFIGYEVARTQIRNRAMIYALLFAYMFYIGMQNALIFFVHDITLQIPFLMLLFWALFTKHTKLFYVLLIVNLGFKESVAVTLFTLGIVLLFYPKLLSRKHAIATILIAVIYGYLSANVIIPYFKYISFGVWGGFGYAPEITPSIFKMATFLMDTSAKRETIRVSLATFGFLPLLSPFSLLLVLQDFVQRFVLIGAGSPLRQGLNLHYNANLAVLLFVGSVYSVKLLKRIPIYSKLIVFHAVAIVILTTYYHQFVYHGPLGLIYNRDFFKITRNLSFITEFVNRVPKRGSIMTQNNLAVRFTHEDLYILTSAKHLYSVLPDVVAMDFRPGQNPNNFWPMTEAEMATLAQAILADPSYEAIFREPNRYIFVKKSN